MKHQAVRLTENMRNPPDKWRLEPEDEPDQFCKLEDLGIGDEFWIRDGWVMTGGTHQGLAITWIHYREAESIERKHKGDTDAINAELYSLMYARGWVRGNFVSYQGKPTIFLEHPGVSASKWRRAAKEVVDYAIEKEAVVIDDTNPRVPRVLHEPEY